MDRRIIRTRRALVGALFGLIEEQGYESLTIQEITSRADINRATFYAHFETKDELLQAGLASLFEELSEQITSAEGLSFVKNTQASLLTFQHIKGRASLYGALLGERGVPYVDRFFISMTAAFTSQKLAQDLACVEGDALWVGWFVGGALLGLVQGWITGGLKESPERMAALTNRLVREGALEVLGAEVSVL